MVNLAKLAQAEEKLTFAEFLTRPWQGDEYSQGAMKHVVEAGILAVQALTDSNLDSPGAMQLALMKFEEPQAKQFSKDIMNIWQQQATQDKRNIKLAINNVQTFITWLKTDQK